MKPEEKLPTLHRVLWKLLKMLLLDRLWKHLFRLKAVVVWSCWWVVCYYQGWYDQYGMQQAGNITITVHIHFAKNYMIDRWYVSVYPHLLLHTFMIMWLCTLSISKLYLHIARNVISMISLDSKAKSGNIVFLSLINVFPPIEKVLDTFQLCS